MNNVYDINKCFNIKNKNQPHLQCLNKRRSNSYFCGVHCKNPIIFQLFIDNNLYKITNVNNNNEKRCELKEDDDMIDDENTEDRELIIFNNMNDLFKHVFDEDKFITIKSLRKSIKNLNLDYIRTKQSKCNIIDDLRRIYDLHNKYIPNIDKVVKVQSYIRKWSVFRRKKCVNDTDIITFDDIFEIPKKYFYVFKDKKTGLEYGYDIRTISHIMMTEKPTCPYTCREFTLDEKNYFINYFDKVRKMGINLDIEKVKLSEEEELEMRMIDIFHKINLLDNYTSHLWFKNLNLDGLKQFYSNAEDMWNYRIQMTQLEKTKYLHNPNAFNLPLQYVRNMNNKHLLYTIILDEIQRFITEGDTREERKLGAMWMLIVLVEVSEDAANALPHLIQFE